jgi:hypothetical protein
MYDIFSKGEIPEELEIIDEEMYNKLKKVAINPNLEGGKFILPNLLRFSKYSFIVYTDLNGEHLRKVEDEHYYYEYDFDGERLLNDAKPIDQANVVEITINAQVCGICKNYYKVIQPSNQKKE